MANNSFIYNITDTQSGGLNIDKLTSEINASTISVSLAHVILTGQEVFAVVFLSDISALEKADLDNIIASHNGEHLIDESFKVQIHSSPAFADKVLPDGKKLFKRVHGVTTSIDNETKNIELVVPYANCKITGVEMINSSMGDKVNLKVLDTATGTISTIPNYMLNQFGFDVYLAKDYHKETSAYDADLIEGMKLVVEYTSADTKDVYINFILHEVK